MDVILEEKDELLCNFLIVSKDMNQKFLTLRKSVSITGFFSSIGLAVDSLNNSLTYSIISSNNLFKCVAPLHSKK